ncbi:hypothetical protein P8452_13511 [Trifolium repens]|nr:hypothetical protein P8452_13511 [Trifolium repens]
MAKCEIKNIVSVLVMIVLVVAQTYGSPVTPSPKQDIICVGECALECVGLIEEAPIYAACIAACGLLKCHKVSSKSAYSCATTCIISKSIKVNTDARSVNAIANSCVEACKNK